MIWSSSQILRLIREASQLRNSRRKNDQVFSLYALVEKTREGWRG